MTERWLTFREDKFPEAAEVLLAWHAELSETDRGGRARLRRAANPDEVVFEPAFHHLLWRLQGLGSEVNFRRHRVALVAGVVAHVDEHRAEPRLAVQMATPRVASSALPTVNETRFRRLMAIDPAAIDELHEHLSRIVRLLGRTLNALDLADAAYSWSPWIRRRWAYIYYENLPRKKEMI